MALATSVTKTGCILKAVTAEAARVVGQSEGRLPTGGPAYKLAQRSTALVDAAVDQREDWLAFSHKGHVVEEPVLAAGHGGWAEDGGAGERRFDCLLARKLEQGGAMY